MKLIGAVRRLLGWVITLFGMHLTPERGRAHRPRIGRHRGESVRNHRGSAGSLQQERGLEELNAPALQRQPKPLWSEHTNEKNKKLLSLSLHSSRWLWRLGIAVHAQSSAPAAAAPAAPPPTAELAAAAARRPPRPIWPRAIPAARSPERSTTCRRPIPKSASRFRTSPIKSGRTKSPPTSSGRWSPASWSCSCRPGFAMVESGLCRVKNANHTYMMNFFVYTCGSVLLLDHRLRHTNGRSRRQRQPRRPPIADRRTHPLVVRQDVGPLRAEPGCSCPATLMTSASW